jgi:hypothetical protein
MKSGGSAHRSCDGYNCATQVSDVRSQINCPDVAQCAVTQLTSALPSTRWSLLRLLNANNVCPSATVSPSTEAGIVSICDLVSTILVTRLTTQAHDAA